MLTNSSMRSGWSSNLLIVVLNPGTRPLNFSNASMFVRRDLRCAAASLESDLWFKSAHWDKYRIEVYYLHSFSLVTGKLSFHSIIQHSAGINKRIYPSWDPACSLQVWTHGSEFA